MQIANTIPASPTRAAGGFAWPTASAGSPASLRPIFGRVFHDTDNGAGGGGQAGSEGGGAGAGDDDNSPRFTQKQLDEVVGRRLEQERRKWDREFQTKFDDELNKRQSSKDKEKDRGDKGEKASKDKDEATVPKSEFDNLRSQMEATHRDHLAEKDTALADKDKVIASLLGEKRDAAIINAASIHNAVNPKQIAKLIGDAVGFDEDGAVVVYQPDGKSPRYGKDGNYLTVEDYVADFAKANAHLFKAEMNPGAGGKGGSNPGSKHLQNLSSQQKIATGLTQKLNGR